MDLVIGEGPSARSIRLDLTSFTMIGATTRAGLLTSPLRDRFGISQRLEFYNTDELTKIVIRSAGILGVSIDEEGAHVHLLHQWIPLECRLNGSLFLLTHPCCRILTAEKYQNDPLMVK